MSATVPFRVHFTDGTHVDVRASNTTDARDVAREIKGRGIVSKVKVIKEEVSM